MLNLFRRLLALLSPTQRHLRQMRRAKEVLDKHGLVALDWLDDAPLDLAEVKKGNMSLFSAVAVLRRNGCLVVDKDLRLLGRVARAFPATDNLGDLQIETLRGVRATNRDTPRPDVEKGGHR